MTVCIIPARGGSKRLKNKNFLLFKGKPMVQHVIECARSSKVFSDVIVSSDSDIILNIATKAGASIHHRNENLAKDNSTVVEVCEKVLNSVSTDIFCCIYPTSVLLSRDTLINSFEEFTNPVGEEAHVLMGVSKFNYPPFQALIKERDGFWSLMLQDYSSVQSQKYPDARVSNGSFYWGRKDKFLLEKTFYSPKLKIYDVDEIEASDLNTPEDYQQLLNLQ